MRRPIFTLIALLAVLVAGPAVADETMPEAVAPEARAKAVVPEPTRDFAKVAKGEQLVHEFEIRNEGTVPLALLSVRPACGCTVAEFDEMIAPGEVGKVRAVVDTTSFFGPIAKSVAVFTNDPENPKLQLMVKAIVEPYLILQPGYARWSYVQGENIESITQTLRADDGERFQVLEVKVPYDFVTVTQRDISTADTSEYEFDVLLDKQAPVGALREYVEIVTDHPQQAIVQIPLTGFVRPRQHATPKEVEFGEIEQAHLPQRRVISFTNFAAEGVEVKSIESDVAGVDAKVQTADERGHRFKLMLEVGPEVQTGPFSGELLIHTTDPQVPVYRLPVSGSVL